MKKVWILIVACVLVLAGCKKSTDLEKISQSLNTYTMDLTLDVDNHTVVGTQTLSYHNTTETILEKVCFHLYPRAFSSYAINRPVTKLNEANAYPNGESFGDIMIDEVKVGGKTTEVTYTGVDQDILNVPVSLGLGETVVFEMRYHIELPNINHRFGYGQDTINLANFYPIACVYDHGFVTDPYDPNGDPFYSDVANYKVTMTYPEGYTMAHTGEEKNSKTGDGLITKELEAKVVRDFAMVFSNKFEVVSDKIDNVDVKYYYYNQENPEVYLQTAMDAITTFSEMFGEYPYSTYSVVQSDFMHGGMEYPMLVYISDDVTDSRDYKNVIIHETAHQWWYGLVGNSAYQHAWMDEGLTDYSTILFYEKNSDYGITYEEAIKNTNASYVSFVELCEDVLGSVDTSMNRPVCDYDTEPEYVYMTYVKGTLLFDNLRDLMGDKKFFKALSKYCSQYQFDNVVPDQMIATFESVYGTKLSAFFDSWLTGKVVIQ